MPTKMFAVRAESVEVLFADGVGVILRQARMDSSLDQSYWQRAQGIQVGWCDKNTIACRGTYLVVALALLLYAQELPSNKPFKFGT